MKLSFSFFSLLLFVSLAIFTSCSKEKDSATPNNGLAPEGQMIATVNGETRTPNIVTASVNPFEAYRT